MADFMTPKTDIKVTVTPEMSIQITGYFLFAIQLQTHLPLASL